MAAAVAPDLAAVQARRVVLGLLATGPLVGPTWLAAVAANGLPPWRYRRGWVEHVPDLRRVQG